MSQQQIHMFAMCLNEERMIPYFLAHYGGVVTRFHIFDNGSTDGSLRLLSGDPRIVVERFVTEEDGFVQTAQRLMNRVWRRAPEADWVVTAEMDEHLHHPDLAGYLRFCTAQGVTSIRAIGFDMVADEFPTDPRPLFMHEVRGVRSEGYDKIAVFDPKAIEDMQYSPGRHHGWPLGQVHWETHRQVKLLHYKYMGLDYVIGRNRALAPGLTPADDSTGAGRHYRRAPHEVDAQLSDYRRRARRVPGLSASDSPQDEPTLDEEIAIVRDSGLFDAQFYAEQNPDVAGSILSPVEHFCIYGCSEGRRPNPMFDPAWYAATYRLRGRGRCNALLDYILDGEARDRMPCVGFDAAIYRSVWSLRPDESAVRHALAPANADLRTAAGRAFEEEIRRHAGPVADDAGARTPDPDQPPNASGDGERIEAEPGAAASAPSEWEESGAAQPDAPAPPPPELAAGPAGEAGAEPSAAVEPPLPSPEPQEVLADGPAGDAQPSPAAAFTGGPSADAADAADAASGADEEAHARAPLRPAGEDAGGGATHAAA